MPSQVELRVTTNNLKLLRRLKIFEARINPAMFAALLTAVKVVKQRALDLVPVRTGKLRDSIDIAMQAGIYKTLATMFTDTDYSRDVEYGIEQRPQPYFGPALFENTFLIVALLRAALKKAAGL